LKSFGTGITRVFFTLAGVEAGEGAVGWGTAGAIVGEVIVWEEELTVCELAPARGAVATRPLGISWTAGTVVDW